MTASRSRISRGRKTQALVAQWFREHGWLFATSRGASEPGTDILHVAPYAVEVKATSAGDIQAALRQAAKNAGEGEVPVVIWRPNGRGPESMGQWVLAMHLEDGTSVLRKAAGLL